MEKIDELLEETESAKVDEFERCRQSKFRSNPEWEYPILLFQFEVGRGRDDDSMRNALGDEYFILLDSHAGHSFLEILLLR